MSIGKPYRRLDGMAKVTGRLRYTGDLAVPGLAHARMVLSPHAHARIVDIRSDRASRLPGVVAVVTARDLPGVVAAGPQRPLALDEVFYAGQPVAVVIGESEEIATDAAAHIEVDYDLLPAVVDPLQALASSSIEVLPTGSDDEEIGAAHGAVTGGRAVDGERPKNATAVSRFAQGDVDSALAASDEVVEGTYRIPPVNHGFLEPHAVIARQEPSGETSIWTCTQGSYLTRELTAQMLGEPLSKIRVVPMPIGGGFGGKFLLLEPLAALLAKKIGRPVRVILDRTDEFLIGRGAPGAVIELRIGAARNGALTALRARAVYDNGASTHYGAAVGTFILAGTYRIPAYEVIGYEVATHKCPVEAYRAPGAPQAFFALESAIDELATRLRIDKIEFRLRNAVREGDPRPDGRVWPRIGFVECLERARAHPLLAAGVGPLQGVGVAAGLWFGGREPATAACRVESDGSLVLQLGSIDLTGSHTGLALIAADTFGIAAEQVRVETGDTSIAPYTGAAGGSKITYTVGPAVQKAAAEARRQVLQIAAEELEAAPDDLLLQEGKVSVKGSPQRALEVGHLAGLATQFDGRHEPVYGVGRAAIQNQAPMFTVHIAQVKVDADTGAFEVTRYAAIQDVGKAINPPEVEGQIHGGALQGLGRALGEELVHDEEGTLRNPTFLDYELPTIDQAPPIEVALVEVPAPDGPFGARGVGEPPAIPAPAAVANAIAAATGIRVTKLPIDIWAEERRLRGRSGVDP